MKLEAYISRPNMRDILIKISNNDYPGCECEDEDCTRESYAFVKRNNNYMFVCGSCDLPEDIEEFNFYKLDVIKNIISNKELSRQPIGRLGLIKHD